MMIHDFDMARFLMGEEFVVVNALGSALVDKAIGEAGDVDTAAVQMQTKSGRIAVLLGFQNATLFDSRIRFVELFADMGVRCVVAAGWVLPCGLARMPWCRS